MLVALGPDQFCKPLCDRADEDSRESETATEATLLKPATEATNGLKPAQTVTTATASANGASSVRTGSNPGGPVPAAVASQERRRAAPADLLAVMLAGRGSTA